MMTTNYLFAKLRICVLSLLVALQISISHSQSTSLVGTIVDGITRHPIPNAIILLQGAGDRTTSDTTGCFRFEQLASGRYTLSVHHIAYADVERRITLASVSNDSISISMQPAIFQSAEMTTRSTRMSSTANSSPYPLHIETNEVLQEIPAIGTPDAMKCVPGISLVRDGPWATDISIRGMSRSNIVTLVDNTRIETASDIAGALSLFNIHDLERIEMVKTSGSVMYGTGALGGVVHLVTKHPSFTEQPQMNAEFTNATSSVDNGLSQYLALDGSTDRYALRMSGGHRRAGNTMTPIGVLPNSQYSDFSLLGSLSLKTFDGHSLLLSYQRSQAEDTGIPGGAPLGASARARYTLARRELFGTEYSIANLSSTLPLLTLRLSNQEIARNVEIALTPAVALTPHATHRTLNAQVESKVVPHADHLLILGGEIWQRVLDSKRERIDKANNWIVRERPIPFSQFLSGGIFAQEEWSIASERLTLISGVRYDWIAVSNEDAWGPDTVGLSGVAQNTSSARNLRWKSNAAHDESWSANFGVTYAVTPALDATLFAASAFRSPSLEERFQFIDLGSVVRIGNPNLQPERSVYFNAGVRAHFEGVRIETDVFLNQLTNLVSETPGTLDGRAAYLKMNIGRARLYGFEFSGVHTWASWGALRASLAYVRAQDTQNNTNLPLIAPLNGQLGFVIVVQHLGAANMSASVFARQDNPATGEMRTPGYMVLDIGFVSVPFAVEDFSFAVRCGVQNLFDKTYQNHLSTLRGVVTSEPGRNYFASATITI